MSAPNPYPEVCEACQAPEEFFERDHRVPRRWGGTNHHSNIQYLCLRCHRKKTFLETSLFDFYAETADVREWYQLAFQDNPHAIRMFVRELEMRVCHFREVMRELVGPEPEPPKPSIAEPRLLAESLRGVTDTVRNPDL